MKEKETVLTKYTKTEDTQILDDSCDEGLDYDSDEDLGDVYFEFGEDDVIEYD